jgi:hypothetical protein
LQDFRKTINSINGIDDEIVSAQNLWYILLERVIKSSMEADVSWEVDFLLVALARSSEF